jgi:arylformamidase
MSHASHFIDITWPLSDSIPVWPGDAPVVVRRTTGISTVSELRLSSHAGTHADAPAHFIPGGGTNDRVPLDALIGPAWVARVEGAALVTAALLEQAGIPAAVERLLVATDNSRAPAPPPEFDRDFVAYDESAIEWLLRRGIRLFGVDAPSIDPFATYRFDAHLALLSQGVVIVENLALHGVAPGAYRLICLPLRYEGGDGAPARAVLERI